MSDNLLTIEEVAKNLQVHWQTVRKYIKDGKLRAHKVGRHVRVRSSDLDQFVNGTSEPKQKYEIEIRFAVEDGRVIQEKLMDLGAEIIYHGHVIDHWYVPNEIKNFEEKCRWYDSAEGYGLRIREQDNGYTGKIHTSLEVKRLVEPMQHNTCIEHEIDVADYKETHALLRLANFKEIVAVDKERLIFEFSSCKIVIDKIKDFMSAVEIERVTDEDRDRTVNELKKVAVELGLDPDRDITEKSVTLIVIEKNAVY